MAVPVTYDWSVVFTSIGDILSNSVSTSVPFNASEVATLTLFANVVVAVPVTYDWSVVFNSIGDILSNSVFTSVPFNVMRGVVMLGIDIPPVMIPPDFFKYRLSASPNVIPVSSPALNNAGLKMGKFSSGGR